MLLCELGQSVVFDMAARGAGVWLGQLTGMDGASSARLASSLTSVHCKPKMAAWSQCTVTTNFQSDIFHGWSRLFKVIL